jgi:outer membrane protein assembly factor BamB
MNAVVKPWLLLIVLLPSSPPFAGAAAPEPGIQQKLRQIGLQRGVCVFLGLPDAGATEVVELARASELLIYVQSADAEEVGAMREAAEKADLLAKRIWVDAGPWSRIQMADNLADAVFVEASAIGDAGVPRKEILRVLHPKATAFCGETEVVKPVPEGLDPWTHPYHGPDNNPQSTDRVARYPYLTQFLAEPLFGCISEVTVAADGRVFKAFGHKAFHKIQNEVLNTLYAINGYNGTILWTRPLKKGFMIHRNTMIATPDVLYLADDESCKLLDARTGQSLGEIKPPAELTEGGVWKWMALDGGVLYCLLGGKEVEVPVRPGSGGGFGGWPWGMWEGYDYQDPKTAFGFGRNLLAIDVASRTVLWHHRAQEHLDGRAVCMCNGRIYAYSPDNFLMSLDAATGDVRWKTSDAGVLTAIGPNQRAQGARAGFSTTVYMKCNDDYLLFSGPQRLNLAAVSTADGKLAWQRADGNFQIVLRDDALYAFGKQGGTSYRLDYRSGDVLDQWLGRRACTRATGSVDSLFCRASGGTIRYVPGENVVQHIAPMRPPCHDGVIVSDGLLYWGPWICACRLSLFGHICLGPAGDFPRDAAADEKERLTIGAGNPSQVADLTEEITLEAGHSGVVRAIRRSHGELLWKHYTGGKVNFPPILGQNRVFVGSDDGRVYAFEAATGRLLWRFQAAPAVRRIPVYGRLTSTWPVSGGLVLHEGTLFAAAGIAHYDGTHVYALDPATGEIKWHNGDSGALNPVIRNGVSLHGQLTVGTTPQHGQVLQFAGGNAVAMAMYDLKTGKCLTPPPTAPVGTARSTFYIQELLNQRQ